MIYRKNKNNVRNHIVTTSLPVLTKITGFDGLVFAVSALNSNALIDKMSVSINDLEYTMPEIQIYTTNICPYCVMAKRLLDKKGARYTEINVDAKPGLREEMMLKTNRRTVPQIYIGDYHVGGFDDLYALEQQKKLDDLLANS